jgi:hypothetical protein
MITYVKTALVGIGTILGYCAICVACYGTVYFVDPFCLRSLVVAIPSLGLGLLGTAFMVRRKRSLVLPIAVWLIMVVVLWVSIAMWQSSIHNRLSQGGIEPIAAPLPSEGAPSEGR